MKERVYLTRFLVDLGHSVSGNHFVVSNIHINTQSFLIEQVIL